MVVDSGQFRLIGAAEWCHFAGWPPPARLDGGLDCCAPNRWEMTCGMRPIPFARGVVMSCPSALIGLVYQAFRAMVRRA